ncbi:MAG: GNAT family N-acetyltransferase [Actinomycetota bacterium]|nr:GNAT family N-acetyltransferase [Actinomycetota bacterium]
MRQLPPRRLTDGDIVVRRYGVADAAALREAIATSLDHLRPWMGWAGDEPRPVQEKEALIARWAELWDAGDEFVYAVTATDDEAAVIGGAGLHPRVGPGALEIGYWVRADRVRRGIAAATARLLTTAALGLKGIERVEIHHDRANRASAGVPRRLGFRFVEERPDAIEAPAEVGLEWVWRMGADQWAAVAPAN